MVRVELRAVSKRFADGTWGLRDVNLTVPGGKLTALLGPSGCGKSTLLRVLAGLENPTQGEVWLDDKDVTPLKPAERNVGMVFQNYALFPNLDVRRNVAFGLRMLGLPARQIRQRVQQVLALVGLLGLDSRWPAQLSGGQQQRVALARALVLEPAVLLFDEPLSNLDARLRRRMREEIRTLQQRLGITVVYVTHDQAEAMAVSDQVAVMNGGRLVQIGSPRDTYEYPANEFVAAFTGAVAVFEAVAQADGSVRLGALTFRPEATPPIGRVRLFVRPEAWQIGPAGRHGLAGKVLHCAYLGRAAEYHVDTELGELLVTSHHVASLLQPGAPVSLKLGMRGVSVDSAWNANEGSNPVNVSRKTMT